jgi:hypothetical protein
MLQLMVTVSIGPSLFIMMERPDVQDKLVAFLNENGIRYEFVNAKKSIRAYDYITGKEESRNIDVNDLLISSYQPKSSLVKVLFEPRSRITDSGNL